MSVETLSVVLHHSAASGTAKLVLLGIANHDGDGGAWPAVDTLAAYANVTPRTVQRALRELEQLGELATDRNAGGQAGQPDWTRPNLYQLTVECPPWCAGGSKHRCREHPGQLAARCPHARPDDVDEDQGDDVPPAPAAPAGDVDDTPGLPVDTAGNGVTPTSPPVRSAPSDPVTLASGGDTHVTGGVTPTSPEPPTNHPSTSARSDVNLTTHLHPSDAADVDDPVRVRVRVLRELVRAGARSCASCHRSAGSCAVYVDAGAGPCCGECRHDVVVPEPVGAR